jgi:hypothetical protein
MNAVLSLIDGKRDIVTVRAKELGPMAGWATGKYTTLCDAVKAEAVKTGHKYYTESIDVYALALDRMAVVRLQATQFVWGEEDHGRPAMEIELNDDRPVFTWYYLLQELRTKSLRQIVVLAIFDGAKFLFEHQVSPRENGASLKANVETFRRKLREAGASEADVARQD